MAKAYSSATLEASASDVWDIVRGFNNLPGWHPAFAESDFDSVSNSRVMKLSDGSPLVESLEAFDNEQWTMRYSITMTELPITRYLGTIKVSEADEGHSVIEWFADFDAETGQTEDMKTALESVYEAGFNALRQHLGG